MCYSEIKMEQAIGQMRKASLFSAVAALFCIVGCGSGTKDTSIPPTTSQQGPQTYFAPYVFNTTNGGANSLLTGVNIYQIDDYADRSFSQSIFTIKTARGPQTINAGTAKAAQRGLLTLEVTANYVPSGNNAYVANTTPPNPNGFAVELANQAGGLIQLGGQPVAPLVAATQCPNLKTAQTYQFITIPGGRSDGSANGSQPPFWDPAKNTAYGSVDIASDGTNVKFNNISQHSFPGGVDTTQSPSKTGLCGPTAFGNTISVPGQLDVTNPGIENNIPPQATIGIGPTGLLLEDNGTSTGKGTYAGISENFLGDGTGAIGLPKPSNALDPNALRGAQYLGFVYGAGVFNNIGGPASGWSSHLVSFGFPSTLPSCVNLPANPTTPLYGGDFANDDPSTPVQNDLAIDLGKQDSAGIFPAATVQLGACYAATGKMYSFPAVAIAGQLNGKYAIFLLGVDLTQPSTQPWLIYLLQSN